MNAKEKILERLNGIKIIDTHEHLLPKEHHCDMFYSFYNLFLPYVQFDLVSAGMDKNLLWRTPKNEQEVFEFWRAAAPYYNHVKNGSYARQAQRVLATFFDIDEINDDNLLEISRRMNATRTQNHYEDIILRKCNIEYVLNQVGQKSFDYKWMKGAVGMEVFCDEQIIKNFVRDNPRSCIHDCLHNTVNIIDCAHREGAVLAKYDASCFYKIADEKSAVECYELLKKDENIDMDEVKYFIYANSLRASAFKEGMIACVHTGVWDDINYKNPLLLFKIVAANPEVTFDIYHLGIPFVRESAFLAKNYKNAYINMCWSHIVSEEMVVASTGEYLDLVPTNKIFAFGADCATLPENIFCHLETAKENLASAFGSRIEKGKLDLDETMRILNDWFYNNPKKVYGL